MIHVEINEFISLCSSFTVYHLPRVYEENYISMYRKNERRRMKFVESKTTKTVHVNIYVQYFALLIKCEHFFLRLIVTKKKLNIHLEASEALYDLHQHRSF